MAFGSGPGTGAKKSFSLGHVLSSEQFSKDDVIAVLDRAQELASLPRAEKNELLKNRLIACIFLEPSTRTRLSFEAACHNLGAKVQT